MSFRARVFALSLLVTAALAIGACGEPPDKELQQAQTAVDEARAAGADKYAHDEFAAAEDALKRARQAVDDRDYRLALNDALDARERARTAAAAAVDQKETTRLDAARTLRAATAAVDQATKKLHEAEAARVPARVLAPHRAAIANGQAVVQKARAAFDRGDYLEVAGPASSVTPRMQAAVHDLDAAVASVPPRRRRG
jgi:hypothetical protein